MNDEMTLGTTTPLPIPPIGWFDYGYAVLGNGSLALVRTDRDVHAEYGRWWAQVRGGGPHAHQPDLRDGRLRLSEFDGSVEIGAIEVSAGDWPKVDRLADGRWLVASSRAAPNENNASLFPIVRVEGGVVRHWRNEIAGARALAVDGDHVLLAGGYKDKSERIALLRLSGDLAQQIGEWRFPAPELNTAHLLQGQGATLHIVGHGRWTKLSLATIRAARNASPTS
jgi:hypothetical protein